MEKKNNVIAIVQARVSSKRLPGKVLKLINKKSVLEILIRRLSKSRQISKIIVACSKKKSDFKIIQLCQKMNIDYFAGSEENVLERFYKTAQKFKAQNILRITGDCPLVDPKIVDNVIEIFHTKKLDYVTNANPPTYPDGFDVEVFTFKALEESFKKAKNPYQKEHVTPYIYQNNKFKKFNVRCKKNFSNLRLTLDEKKDFELISKIFDHFKGNIYFSYEDILKYYKKNKKVFLINIGIKRNEGPHLHEGQKLWKRAKDIIPGGTMLFSKNPDLFLPNFWPAYFKKTKGCLIWDIRGKKFIDLSMMGVGTNTLGYSRREIDKEVKKNIDNGNMSTLNSEEEILLAEKLVDIHPWSSKVRFARTGGDAAAIAVRIARAAKNKNIVAICGYHGWHDWYLSANLANPENLNSHLMKNLPINGVQKNLKNSAIVFEYNNLNQFKKIVKNNDLAAVVMEVSRDQKPKKNFLNKIREITKKKNIALIFDECTTGFRETYGGLHLKYKINPDIATFGKALGNGYAINAVIGRKDIMKYANSTFISSTFWTERIGYVAALKTLDVIKKIKSWKKISTTGKMIKKQWKSLAKKNKIKIKIQGLDSIPNFYFQEHNQIYKTFISQEFLKKGILAGTTIYVCIDHNKKILKRYFQILDQIFKKIKLSQNNHAPEQLLDGPTSISGLRSKT